MDQHIALIQGIYQDFNARDIEGVLAALAEDVAWANGMDGGHERGLEAVRAYWTRQWAVVSPLVVPQSFETLDDGTVLVTVQQSIRDLEGRPIEAADHGLRDKLVGHRFRIHEGKVIRFDIQELVDSNEPRHV